MPYTQWRTPLLGLLLLFLCYSSKAEYRARCSNITESTTSMKPSEDGISGRYNIEWCTNLNKNDTVWNLELAYNRRNPKTCYNRNRHSVKTEYLNDLNLNCTHVCLSTDVDLIFSTCYTLQNLLPSRGSMRDISTHNISNEYTLETFKTATYTGNIVNHGDYVSAHFYMGVIPVTEFEIELCRKVNNSYHEWSCADVSDNCSRASREVWCSVRAPPAAYDLRLSHRAPWVGGDFVLGKENTHLPFVVSEAAAAEVTGGGGGGGGALLWAGAALAALAGAGLALLLALRGARAARMRRHVLHDWLHRQEAKAVGPMEGGTEDVRPILLVYAREGPAAEPAIAAVTRLLETIAPGQVYDLYEARTVSQWAEGPAQWVRAMLARRARLLLLQTPALRLHAQEEPLLGRRGVYRCPAPADGLLPLALRLADTAPAPYTQYYLATLEGLETEALPYTVPFRRYVLPRHAAALLHDLAPSQLPPQLPPQVPPLPPPHKQQQQQIVDELARAVVDFVDHVRANPDYLMDQLIFM